MWRGICRAVFGLSVLPLVVFFVKQKTTDYDYRAILVVSYRNVSYRLSEQSSSSTTFLLTCRTVYELLRSRETVEGFDSHGMKIDVFIQCDVVHFDL